MKKKKTRKPFDEEKYYADWERRKAIREKKEREAYLASLSPEELELLEIDNEQRAKDREWVAETNRKYAKRRLARIKKMRKIKATFKEGVEWWKDVYDGVMDNILFFLPPKRKER